MNLNEAYFNGWRNDLRPDKEIEFDIKCYFNDYKRQPIPRDHSKDGDPTNIVTIIATQKNKKKYIYRYIHVYTIMLYTCTV